MISLALLGILQAVLLPGLVVILWATRGSSLHWADKWLFSTPLSISLNYVLVVLMTWSGAYTSANLCLVFGFELFFLAVYLLKSKSDNRAQWHVKSLISDLNDFVLGIFSLRGFAFFYLLIVFISHGLWGVFTDWDAVVSWNRWARDWFNQSPAGSIGYPPGLPILYSLVYSSVGTDGIQTFAKLVASYFPFFGVFCILRFGLIDFRLKRGSEFAAIIFLFILQRSYNGSGFIFSGYSDPVMASLGAFAVYSLFFFNDLVCKNKGAQLPRFYCGFLLVLVFVAPALIKQSGVVLAAVTVLCMMLVCYRFITKNVIYFGVLVFLAGLFAVHWYIYSYFIWNDFYVAADAMPTSYLTRLFNSIVLMLKVSSPLVILAASIGLIYKKEFRLGLVFFLLPLWLFWALVVSYDFRTALYFVAAVAICAGFGVDVLFVWLTKYVHSRVGEFERFGVVSVGHLRFGMFSFFIFFLLTLAYIVPPERILASNDRLRMKSNEAGFNKFMVDIFNRSSTSEKTLSCWQMLYNLPGAEGKFVPWGNCDLGHEKWLEDKDIKYFIYWEAAVNPPHSVSDVRQAANKAGIRFVESKLADGYLLFEKLN